MKTTPSQLKILVGLEEKPMGIKEMITELGLSDSYLRVQLRLLEEKGQVEKTDERFPYIYRVPDESPHKKHKAAVSRAKADLISVSESKNPFVDIIKKVPRREWPKAVTGLEAICEAIRQLDAEGKLIDTL